MILLRILLYPMAMAYNFITGLRNRLYDRGLKPSVTFELPVINVGNLTVGGTGKTPLIEYLIRLLAPNRKVATLSRGYGRTTTGFRIAGPSDNAATLGDEPTQFYQKYGDRVTVAVGEERALAIPNILQDHPDTEIILLDDAYQHRKVRPSLNILLSDYSRPFYEDLLLPAGRLRESRHGATRADVVVVTKCPPEISDDEMMDIDQQVRRYVEKPVFFTHVRYGSPMPVTTRAQKLGDDVVLVTGIANAKPLVHYLKQTFNLVKHFDFTDHHTYRASDLEDFAGALKAHPQASFLTTEKDKVKLVSPAFREAIEKIPLFYLPIEVEFIKNGQDFDEIVLNHLKRA
ncbi:tetraacyldisaccharide 4'-kinase [Chryseolinea soli]|uniref:Tetraacyldisaccharide 4'-kinase n=1 Tax=Chryseolinea soli TaxID=2321403 RepID=A0A385SW19_9BACT|nr:tetraacyldisaccharide 4'-kinase [Chryseolinea soli]AYB34165.1 tetraacyldisaccharide 4'-kinase [Chryseolinea soli]